MRKRNKVLNKWLTLEPGGIDHSIMVNIHFFKFQNNRAIIRIDQYLENPVSADFLADSEDPGEDS